MIYSEAFFREAWEFAAERLVTFVATNSKLLPAGLLGCQMLDLALCV